MVIFNCVYTDTYGGTPNFSWRREQQITVTDSASRQTIIRRAKAALGLTGQRCRTTDLGDSYELRPVGYNTVAFVSVAQ